MAHGCHLVDTDCSVEVELDTGYDEGEERGTGCEAGVEHADKDLVGGEDRVTGCLGHEEQEHACSSGPEGQVPADRVGHEEHAA